MYVNDLGMRNADRVNAYKNTIQSRRSTGTGTGTAGVSSFVEQMQRALAAQGISTESKQGSDTSSVDACCEQCRQNGQMLASMMTQSLYLQSGLGGLGSLNGLGLTGYSSVGAGNFAAYQSMMNLLGSQLYSII